MVTESRIPKHNTGVNCIFTKQAIAYLSVNMMCMYHHSSCFSESLGSVRPGSPARLPAVQRSSGSKGQDPSTAYPEPLHRGLRYKPFTNLYDENNIPLATAFRVS